MVPALNPWEERARYRKALRLSAVMLRAVDQFDHVDLDTLRDANPDARHLTAQLAGCNYPSDETWRTAIALTRWALDQRIRRADD